ncbi:MAG: RiPP maturation radical SAM C-methyltransferase [Desulfobacteraceae bacterium]|jgi:ribosomal peptide maturation radical SAM protein 1
MNKKYKNSILKVALISTPWPLYSRPSIQLGALKAYLKARDNDLQVEAHHVYLKLAEAIGYRLYHKISERTWLAESIYATLLFPKRFTQIQKLFDKQTQRKSPLSQTGLKTLSDQVKKTTLDFIDGLDWEACQLVGFTVSLCQLTSALYFIKLIKQKNPKLITVVGGPSFTGTSATDAVRLFPDIDVVVTGEGELPLSQLTGYLKRHIHPKDAPAIQGVFTKSATETQKRQYSFFQMDSLDQLPIPDYGDYFKLLESLDPQKSFFPALPLEISRGCWWKPAVRKTTASGCAFCNLNLQWSGYRSKKPSQVVSEIDTLTDKYKTLSVVFVDNVLPQKTSQAIFEGLEKLEKDLRLFSEIRASVPLAELKVMRASGMREVQIGIEALSTCLLKKIHKGTTAIQNLEIMKNCEALGIENISNLIMHFPGSGAKEINETLRAIEFAMPYRPLKPVDFWLGLESPVWQNPKGYGLKAVFNHPYWGYLFPASIFQSMSFMIQAYRGDLGYQRKIWRPVRKKARGWQRAYRELTHGPSPSPILSFRDGGDFLIIRQRRFQSEPLTHRLMATSRSIYLFCQHHRSIKQIRGQFEAFPEDKIVAFLKMMADKKLMFQENEKYLSLAVPVNPERYT